MALNFLNSLPDGWIAAVQLRGWSVYQAVTMASIIQRETLVEEEMPLDGFRSCITGSTTGMRLQVNPDRAVRGGISGRARRMVG